MALFKFWFPKHEGIQKKHIFKKIIKKISIYITFYSNKMQESCGLLRIFQKKCNFVM